MCEKEKECMEAGDEESRKVKVWHCSDGVLGHISERWPRDGPPQGPLIRGKVKQGPVKKISARARGLSLRMTQR